MRAGFFCPVAVAAKAVAVSATGVDAVVPAVDLSARGFYRPGRGVVSSARGVDASVPIIDVVNDLR